MGIIQVLKQMFESSNLRFLKQLKNDVSNLPWEIWEESEHQKPQLFKKEKVSDWEGHAHRL